MLWEKKQGADHQQAGRKDGFRNTKVQNIHVRAVNSNCNFRAEKGVRKPTASEYLWRTVFFKEILNRLNRYNVQI